MSKFGRVHIDQALTNVSLGFPRQEFIAERVYPEVQCDKQTGLYWVHGRDSWDVTEDLRQPGDEAKPVHLTVANAPYHCDGHALKDYVPREDQENAQPQMDLLTDTTEALTERMYRNKEVNLVAQLRAVMLGTSLADQVGTPWNNNANNPIALINAQRMVIGLRCGKMPNKFACGQDTWNAIANNTNVTGRITGAPSLEASKITPQQFASLIEVDEVIIGAATRNTAQPGQAVAGGWIWQDLGLLFYRPPAPGRKTLSLGYTFKWTRAFGQAQAQMVRRYYVDERLSDCVEVHEYYDLRSISIAAGVLFDNCVA